MDKAILKEAAGLSAHLEAMAKFGLDLGPARVWLALIEQLDPEAGEVTSVASVAEIAGRTGYSHDQVSRYLAALRAKGFIARRQLVKRAGESAFTTLMPAGLQALGLIDPGATPDDALAGPLPADLVAALCTQSWAVVDGVRRAWSEGTSLPDAVLSELRGGAVVQATIERALQRRRETATAAIEAAVAETMSREALAAAGLDIVKTNDGPVTVDTAGFEAHCPVAVPWQYVKDVLTEIAFIDIRLLTRANLKERMAEIAYARCALPFAKNNAWETSVRVLGRQITTSWSKPRKIWPSWYAAADRALIHSPAVSAAH